jgi:hypothetical protein
LVTNEGTAPLYRDAWFAIGSLRSEQTLRGLLPDEERWVEVPAACQADGSDIRIVSDAILPSQDIEFSADIQPSDGIGSLAVPSAVPVYYSLSGLRMSFPARGINLVRNGKTVRKIVCPRP